MTSKLLNKIKDDTDWVIKKESFLGAFNKRHIKYFKKNMIQIESKDKRFKIVVNWQPENDPKGYWILRFYHITKKSILFTEDKRK